MLKGFLIRPEDIDKIIPMGMMVWGHVVPSDHLSVQPKDRKAPKAFYAVMAPADGFIVDPFDYVAGSLRYQLLELNPRKAAPLGGKIDYDVDGKLVGSWYRAGSGGYAGANRRLDDWVGHLALAYHHIDPGKIVVSLGDFQGQPRQFWVKGNGPDPGKVSESDGAIRYELVYGALDNSGRPYDRSGPQAVHGVLLLQLLPQQRLKVEVFPRKSAGEVTGFTEMANEYER